MGWFFGFKLHLIINDKGEILNFMFTAADVDDREPLKEGALLKNISVNGSVITNYNSSTKVCLKANGGAFSADRHTTYEFGEYELSVGENVIVITFNASGAAFIDYFTVIPVED